MRPINTWALVLLFLLSGCEEDVTAPRRMEEPFSMYGIINPRRDLQTVAVSPIEPLLYDYPETIDAVVTSTDLETEQTVAWRDTVVVGERGQLEHVFMADFRPPFGSSYRVEAVRSDGATTSAVAHVPSRVDVEARRGSSGRLEIHITGSDFHLLSIDVVYFLRSYPRSTGDPCSMPPFSHRVSYDRDEIETEDGYRFEINLGLDYFNIEYLYILNPAAFGVALMGMSVRFLVAEPAWDPPGGVFDENLLADPDVMTNTVNGFGLVAGGYTDGSAVYPPEEIIAGTRFFDFIVRPPAECLQYCGCR